MVLGRLNKSSKDHHALCSTLAGTRNQQSSVATSNQNNLMATKKRSAFFNDPCFLKQDMSPSHRSKVLMLLGDLASQGKETLLLVQLLKFSESDHALQLIQHLCAIGTLSTTTLLNMAMYAVYKQSAYTAVTGFKLDQVKRLMRTETRSKQGVDRIAKRAHLMLKWRYLKHSTGLPKYLIKDLARGCYNDAMLDYVIISYLQVLRIAAPKCCDKFTLNWLYKQLMCRVLFYRNHKMMMVLQSYNW